MALRHDRLAELYIIPMALRCEKSVVQLTAQMERYAVKLDRQLTAIKKSQGFGNTLVTFCPAATPHLSGGDFINQEEVL